VGFAEVKAKLKYPQKTSDRYKRLDAFDRLRDGTIYDGISTPFDKEYSGSTYVKIRDRRPDVRWTGAAMLVDQLSGLLWGDEQMPIIRTYEGEDPDKTQQQAEKSIQKLAEDLTLDAIMDEVTEKASSGSAAIIVRATDDRDLYIEVVPGKECRPYFDPTNPNRLLKIEQCYPTKGEALRDLGYDIPEDKLKADYWYRLTIDADEEIRYEPLSDDLYSRLGQHDSSGAVIAWKPDDRPEFSGPHGWPILPVLWCKSPKGNRIDGACMYELIADNLIAIDYNLSQVGRGFRYTADPMLMVKRGELNSAGTVPADYGEEPDKTQRDEAGNVVKSPANVLDIDAGGDAKMLEISGQGLSAMVDYIKLLREWGLEICGGMKSDAETTKGVESGRALEMLYQALILVVKRWRVALGTKGYLPLVRLILTGIECGLLDFEGVDAIPPEVTMRLVWPTWMTPSGQDLVAEANAWQTLAGGSPKDPVVILPPKIVTRLAATNLGMNDVTAILEELEAHNKDMADQAEQAAQASADRTVQTQTAIAAAKPAAAPPSGAGGGNTR
jgi:hypothetical protein